MGNSDGRRRCSLRVRVRRYTERVGVDICVECGKGCWQEWVYVRREE